MGLNIRMIQLQLIQDLSNNKAFENQKNMIRSRNQQRTPAC